MAALAARQGGASAPLPPASACEQVTPEVPVPARRPFDVRAPGPPRGLMASPTLPETRECRVTLA